MKAVARQPATTVATVPVVTVFVRGFVVTALLTAARDHGVTGRHVLGRAVQGGTALAAGTVAAEAVARRDYTTALAAVTAGAAGVLVAEALLRPDSRNPDPVHADKEIDVV